MLMFKSKKIIKSLEEENKKLKDKIEELFLVEEKESLSRRDFNILENRFKNEERERVRLGEKVVNLREEYKAKKSEFNVLENRFKNEERERKKLEVKLISMKEELLQNKKT